MDKIHQLWNLEGTIVPVDVGLGFYVIRFESKVDYLRVYMGGPWIIQDHYLTVRKWHSDFKADMAVATKTAIWVRLPLLPMEYYDEATLDVIADKLGKRLKVDNKTVISARGSYARICVELDLSKPLEPSIAVGKFDYMLEYEHIHLICFSCGRVGHRKEACRNSPTAGAPADAANPNVDSTGKADTSDVKFNGQVAENGIAEIGFGEWMIVSRKSKWPNRSSGPFKTEAQSEGFKYRNNNYKSHPESDHTGPSKVQSNGPLNKRGPLLRNSAQQNLAQSKKPTNNLSSDPKGSRFTPLIEADSDNRPQPVLVPIKSVPAQKQKGKGQLIQEVSRPQKVYSAVNDITVDLEIGNPCISTPPTHTPSPSFSTQPPLPQTATNLSLVDTAKLGRPPDPISINTLTFHEFARNSEISHSIPQDQDQGVVRNRDRSNSPSRGHMVVGKAKHEDKTSRSTRRRHRITPGGVETDSAPSSQPN
ncbi:hypothetical protein RHMOL_Rhmol12G0060300 [Rhododendron molle]|uniref:Uncharacterized protein n=1 Tax=Rhododendron molle TaxID=49168 RepID=A0ACC0LG41_RHOML|nr:hypothetical protein RHMOL_Rhmol12G0060300 [Rhododendron molle]